MTVMDALLSIRDLDVRYGAIHALNGVSFDVPYGEVVTLLGANGAGKTTTLSSIIGLVPKASGTVMFNGVDISRYSPEMVVRGGMTLSPEGRRVFPSLTVLDNLELGGATVPKSERMHLQNDMFELFPILATRRHQLAGSLSGGEQQQLAIARALMCRPSMLLLDEPSLGLAPQIVEDIFDLIGRLKERKVTVLIVEQNVPMALSISDRGYVMANGRIVLQGTAEELSRSNDIANTFLGINPNE